MPPQDVQRTEGRHPEGRSQAETGADFDFAALGIRVVHPLAADIPLPHSQFHKFPKGEVPRLNQPLVSAMVTSEV
jgi:hypothetical protein